MERKAQEARETDEKMAKESENNAQNKLQRLLSIASESDQYPVRKRRRVVKERVQIRKGNRNNRQNKNAQTN